MSNLSKPFDVLDHGYVLLDGYLGDDESIVKKARITTESLRKTQRSTEAFLEYLWGHQHTSPFDFPTICLKVKAPLFVCRQWWRHRTAVCNEVVETTDTLTYQYNANQEYSGRYAPMTDEYYTPPIEQLVKQAEGNHQMSSGELVEYPEGVRISLDVILKSLRDGYEFLLQAGLARERARIVLPMAQYTTFYFQQSLRNLLHWLALRREDGAQWEIRQYAQAVEVIVQELFPKTYSVWLEHVEGCHVSWKERQELQLLLDGKVVSHRLREKLFKGAE